MLLAANQTLGVIGCGTMGEAIVRGVLQSGNLLPAQIFASDARAEIAAGLASKHGIRTGTDNLAVANACNVALIAVKPYQIASVLDNEAMRTALSGKVVISIAALLVSVGEAMPGCRIEIRDPQGRAGRRIFGGVVE